MSKRDGFSQFVLFSPRTLAKPTTTTYYEGWLSINALWAWYKAVRQRHRRTAAMSLDIWASALT